MKRGQPSASTSSTLRRRAARRGSGSALPAASASRADERRHLARDADVPEASGAVRRHVELEHPSGGRASRRTSSPARARPRRQRGCPRATSPSPSSSSAHSMPGETMPRTGFSPSATPFGQRRAGPRPQHEPPASGTLGAPHTTCVACRCRRRHRRSVSLAALRDAAACRRPRATTTPEKRRRARARPRPRARPSSAAARLVGVERRVDELAQPANRDLHGDLVIGTAAGSAGRPRRTA